MVSRRALVIGAAGMIGRKLVERLSQDGSSERLTLHDVVPFESRHKTVVSDLSTPGEADKLVAERPDLIFHLAAVVSGEAEADFRSRRRNRAYLETIGGRDYLPIESVRESRHPQQIYRGRGRAPG